MIKPLKDGIRSIVKIDFHGNVHKTFRGTDRDLRHANEVSVLKVLEERGCPNVPRLLDYDDDGLWILTTNCGHPVESTITRVKNDALYAELEEKYGVRHDDPEPRNVTYSQSLGCFCLIDFELAEVLNFEGQDSCAIDSMLCDWIGVSSKGQKENNEDAWRVLSVERDGVKWATADEAHNLCEYPLFAAVADGIGGGGFGDLASKYVVDSLSWELERVDAKYLEKPSESFLNLLCNSLNKRLAVTQKSDEALKKMGSTLALVSLFKDELTVANVGDSRVYHWRSGEMAQLSEDHTFAWKQFNRGELSELQLRQHPRKSVLYESVNGADREIYPSLNREKVQAGDFVLICSDGLIDGLWDKHILEILSKSEKAPLEEIAQELVTRARDGDPRDDCTLVLLRMVQII